MATSLMQPGFTLVLLLLLLLLLLPKQLVEAVTVCKPLLFSGKKTPTHQG